MYSVVHSSVIYSGQDVEMTEMSTNRWRNKENVIYIYIYIYVHTYVYISTHTCKYEWYLNMIIQHVNMNVCKYIYLHTLHIFIYKYMSVWIYINVKMWYIYHGLYMYNPWYIYTHTEVLLSHKKEQNNTICSNMDITRDYHTKWGNSERERQITQDITHMWNLKFGTTAWMGVGLEGEWIHVYVWLSPFTIHLKLSQHF